MGLVTRVLKTKRNDFFEQIVNEIANEEKSKSLLKSPFLEGRKLELNRNGILSFVIAAFCFEWAFNTRLKDAKFKKEVLEMILMNNKSEEYELFFYAFYKISQIPFNTHVMWEATYAYLKIIWGIQDKIPDPVLLTAYSAYITQLRVNIKKKIENSFSDLVQCETEISGKESDNNIQNRSLKAVTKIKYVIKLLIQTAELDSSPNDLISCCINSRMSQIEYLNFDNDPLFSNGNCFQFNCDNGEQGKIEIIEVKGKILQSGFQIIYYPRLFSSKTKKDFLAIRNYIKDHYQNESIQKVNKVNIFNFTNEISQSYTSQSKINGRFVINFKVMNKKNWEALNKSDIESNFTKKTSVGTMLAIIKAAKKKGQSNSSN